jgi:hypothetical protein
MRTKFHLMALAVVAWSFGCAHKPVSASDLAATGRIAFVGRIHDEAGPVSTVFRDDSSYRDKLAPRRIDDKEADRRLAVVLRGGSKEDRKRGSIMAHSVSRFEMADSIRANTLAKLPKTHPWDAVVDPASVARALESFLVQEVPANDPDYERIRPLGADTVLELIIDEYGMRSRSGRAGVYISGVAKMFRIGGGLLYVRRFHSDDVDSGEPHLDPFLVSKDAGLFASRIRQSIVAIADQIAKDLTPPEPIRTSTVGRGDSATPDAQPPTSTEQLPAADDPL